MPRIALALLVLPLSAIIAACSSSSGLGSPADGGADGTTDTGSSDTGGSDTAAGDTSSGDTGNGCPTSNTVVGTVGGVTLAPMSAAAVLGIADASYPNQLTVIVANVPDVCSVIQSLVAHPNQFAASLDQLLLTLGETSAAAGPVTIGTYTPTSMPSMPDELTATFESFDATCQPTGDAGAPEETAGQVVLCSAGPTYAGTFDLTFGSDHVTGTFSAPLCQVGGTAPPLGDGGACQ